MAKKSEGVFPIGEVDTGALKDRLNRPFDSFSTGAEEARLSHKLAQLRIKERELIQQLVPTCHCDNTDIRVKTSAHLASVWNGVVGPASSGPTYSTHVDFLYCENCGRTFYKSGVQEIENIALQIREKDEELSRLRNPRRC